MATLSSHLRSVRAVALVSASLFLLSGEGHARVRPQAGAIPIVICTPQGRTTVMWPAPTMAKPL